MGTLVTKGRAERALGPALGLWVVGVQVHELFASVGAALTLALALAVVGLKPLKAERRTALALLAFLALSLVLPLFSGHGPNALGIGRWLNWWPFFGAFLAVGCLSAAALTRVAVAGAVALFVSSTVAVFQHLGAWPAAEFFAPLSSLPLGFHRVYEAVPGRDDRFFAGGLLLHRLKFANVTAVVCVLAAAGASLRAPRRWLWALAVVVGLLAITRLSYARAATAAAVLASGLVFVLGQQKRGRALLLSGAAGLLVLGVVAATPSLRTRFASSLTNEGSGERAMLTKAGLDAIAAHPVTGAGLGHFRAADYVPKDAPTPVLEHTGQAHNQLVSLAADVGLPATLAFLIFLGLLTWRFFRAGRPGAPGMAVVALFALLSLLHDPLFHAETALALALALGATLGLVARTTPPASPV